MGLDMCLYGEDVALELNERKELAYWRKHPQLHGYIVNTFAAGIDECQSINLSLEDMKDIIEAIKTDSMFDKVVTGFFFGRSYFPTDDEYDEQKKEDLEYFLSAISWKLEDDEHREIYYQSSW